MMGQYTRNCIGLLFVKDTVITNNINHFMTKHYKMSV